MQRNIIILLCLICSFMIEAAYAETLQESFRNDRGVLWGKVSIGPLCPVEPCNLFPEQIAQIYGGRKIVIYESDTKNQIAKIGLDQNGEFSISLKPGKYLIDVTDSQGKELPLDKPRVRRGNLGSPKQVEIKAGEKTQLVLDIDSGIR